MKKMLNSEEIMEFLGISRATLTRYINQKGMPVIRITTRKNMFDLDAVKNWLAQHAEGGRKEG